MEQAALVSFSRREILLFSSPHAALKWLGEPGNEIGLIDYMGTEDGFFKRYPSEIERRDTWERVEMAEVMELRQ